jgi:hypothetical protein
LLDSTMCAVAPIRYWFLPLFGLMVLARPLAADSSLLENSPFLPPNVSGAAGAGSAPLELRSVVREGGEYEFSLYDTAKRQSTWVKLNEPGHDFVVKAYDPANESVTVEQQNRTYKLALKEVKIVPLAVVAVPGVIQPQPPGGMPPGAVPLIGTRMQTGPPMPGMGRGPNAVGPVPSLTPEQLRNLEADINRRRELRRQAAAAMAQPSPVAPQNQQR